MATADPNATESGLGAAENTSFFCSDSSDEHSSSDEQQWEVTPERNVEHRPDALSLGAGEEQPVGSVPSPELRCKLMQCTREHLLQQHKQSSEQCDRCMSMGSERCMATSPRGEDLAYCAGSLLLWQ